MAAQPSIFARIAAGEIPCQKVFENDLLLAFLDVNPLAEGHTLVIPKRAVERLGDLTAQEAAEFGRQIPLLARRIMTATGAPACNILQNDGRAAGQEVPHVHFHVIPRKTGDAFQFNWPAGSYAPGEIEQVAEAIRAKMKE